MIIPMISLYIAYIVILRSVSGSESCLHPAIVWWTTQTRCQRSYFKAPALPSPGHCRSHQWLNCHFSERNLWTRVQHLVIVGSAISISRSTKLYDKALLLFWTSLSGWANLELADLLSSASSYANAGMICAVLQRRSNVSQWLLGFIFPCYY